MLNLINFFMNKKRTPTQKKVCDVSGIKTNVENFYKNQSHVKAIDNLRRATGANKNQLKRMFNQLNSY